MTGSVSRIDSELLSVYMRRVCLTQSRRSWCSAFQVVDQCLGGYAFNGGCREPEDLYMISCMNGSITGSEQLGREAKRGRPIIMPWRICSTCAARNDADWHENCIVV